MSKLTDTIGTFTAIPNSVIKMTALIGSDGMTLFVYLRYRTNSESEIAFPSYDTIQNETGLTRRRIAQAIRSLESAKLVDRKRRFGGSTIYTLKMPLVQHMDYSSPAAGLSLVQHMHTIKKESIKNSAKPAPIPPAVEAYRRSLGRYPNKQFWDSMEQAVGADLERWESHCQQWGLRGFNPANLQGIFESFKQGFRKNGNGNHYHQTSEAKPMTTQDLCNEFFRDNPRELRNSKEIAYWQAKGAIVKGALV